MTRSEERDYDLQLLSRQIKVVGSDTEEVHDLATDALDIARGAATGIEELTLTTDDRLAFMAEQLQRVEDSGARVEHLLRAVGAALVPLVNREFARMTPAELRAANQRLCADLASGELALFADLSPAKQLAVARSAQQFLASPDIVG